MNILDTNLVEKGKEFCQSQPFEMCSTLVVEEMSELTKELMKCVRGASHIDNPHLIEEIGDVQLTLNNLIHCLDCGDKVEESINAKYYRSYKRYVEPNETEG